jgi:hypothetical protein
MCGIHIRESWMKGLWELSVLSLQLFCKCKIILELKSLKEKNLSNSTICVHKDMYVCECS